MIRVYVAGPYSRPDPAENTRRAMEAAHELMDRGYAPFVPHLTHFLELHRSRPYEDWMALDFAFLPLCNAVLRLPGDSPGADRETALADKLSVPVFHDPAALDAYFRRPPGGG